MGVGSNNFSTYPEDSDKNVSALNQLLENHDKNSEAHSEQFDHLADEIGKVDKKLDECAGNVLDAKDTVVKAHAEVMSARDDVSSIAGGVRKSADDVAVIAGEISKAKAEIDSSKGTVQELVRVAGGKVEEYEQTAERVGKMISDAAAIKETAESAEVSAGNYAEVSKGKAEEAAKAAREAGVQAGRAQASMEIVIGRSPKIINGVWWVFDGEKGEMVSTGIKAEGRDGYTPRRGTDYWTGEDREKIKREVASAIKPVIIGDMWHIYDSDAGTVVSTGVRAVAKDGYTPRKGIDYFDGENGEPGYTPQKGKDYYTEEEKAEIYEYINAKFDSNVLEALEGDY